MKHPHTRHLRLVVTDEREKFNRASHSDALREMQIVPFDHATPLKVIRSIDRSEAIWSTIIFLALGFCVGALFAIGN